MRTNRRRNLARVAIPFLAVAATVASPVAAAVPPAGIVLDGVVAVDVREAVEGVPTGPPVAGAAVTVVAYVTDFPEDAPLQEPLRGTTGADGRVTFTGVARSDAGGPAVHLAIDALGESVAPDEAGCTATEVWFGSATDVPATAVLSVVVEATVERRVVCPSRPLLEGRLLDSRGDPLAVQHAVATVAGPGGETQVVAIGVGLDGAFSVQLPAVGTWAEPATVSLDALSPPTRSERFADGCLRTYAERVTWTTQAALAEGAVIPPVELAAVEIVAGERCGTIAPDRPGPTAEPSRPAAAPAPTPAQPPRARRPEPATPLPAIEAPDVSASPSDRVPVAARAPATVRQTTLAGPATVAPINPPTPPASSDTRPIVGVLLLLAVGLLVSVRRARRG